MTPKAKPEPGGRAFDKQLLLHDLKRPIKTKPSQADARAEAQSSHLAPQGTPTKRAPQAESSRLGDAEHQPSSQVLVENNYQSKPVNAGAYSRPKQEELCGSG